MAKTKSKFIVIAEGDVYATGYKLQIRKDTPSAKLKEFYDKFNERNQKYVAQFVKKVDVEESKEDTVSAEEA